MVYLTNSMEKTLRFKTDEELIEEYGDDWKITIHPSFNTRGEMDYLLGQNLDSFKYKETLNGSIRVERKNPNFKGQTWIVSPDRLTTKPLTYIVKKGGLFNI